MGAVFFIGFGGPSGSVKGLLVTDLTTLIGTQDKQVVETVGYYAEGDGGGGPFWWDAGSAVAANGGTVLGSSGSGRWFRRYDGGLELVWFGAVGDGVTNNTTVWDTWLAAVCASPNRTGFISRGTFGIDRRFAADNITVDNVEIQGLPGSSIVDLADVAANEFYNAFQATGRTNIKLKNISFAAITLAYFTGCTDVVIQNCQGNGMQATATHIGWHWNKAIYLVSCINSIITNNQIYDFEFSVYFGGSLGARCKRSIVSNNNFYDTALTTRPGADFPVGVYAFFADDVLITANTFYNIRSAVSGGTPTTGCGFGVYEGDGACSALVVANNTFLSDVAGTFRMDAIFTQYGKNTVLEGNTIRYLNTAPGVPFNLGVLSNAAAEAGDQKLVVCNNIIFRDAPSGNQQHINCNVTGDIATYAAEVVIQGNTFDGGRLIFAKNTVDRKVQFRILNNIVRNSPVGSAIQILGTNTICIVNPEVSGNTIEKGFAAGIEIQGSVRSKVHNNTILDCNQGNDAGNEILYTGIVFPSFGYGASLKGNHIENRPGYGGHMLQAISGFSTVERFAWKYDTSNTSNDMPANVPTMSNRFYAAAPVGGWDWRRGDVAYRAATAAGSNPFYVCTQRVQTTLLTQLNTGDTNVNVASTASMLAGDVFQIIVDPTTLDANAGTTAQHYYGVVQTIVDGTNLTLSVAVPAGYAFPIATAQVAVLRWKAGAAIAA